MQKLRIGVIGYGFMGKMHAGIYRDLPQTELVAISDVDETRFLQDPIPGVKFFKDFNGMMKDKSIDAVSICVGDRVHLEPAVAAAQARKHIFLEKPIALEMDEARQIESAARKANVKLMIGFLLRFDPRYAALKEYITQGKIGEVVHIHARRNSPKSEGPARYKGSTSLVFHVTIHDLDLIFWLLNRRVSSVYAQATRKALKAGGGRQHVRIIRFEDDTLSTWKVLGTPEDPQPNDAYLNSWSKGMARRECGYSGFGSGLPQTRIFRIRCTAAMQKPRGDLRLELSAFANAVIHDTPTPVTGEDGIRSLELAWAIQESIDTGKVITP